MFVNIKDVSLGIGGIILCLNKQKEKKIHNSNDRDQNYYPHFFPYTKLAVKRLIEIRKFKDWNNWILNHIEYRTFPMVFSTNICNINKKKPFNQKLSKIIFISLLSFVSLWVSCICVIFIWLVCHYSTDDEILFPFISRSFSFFLHLTLSIPI